MLSKLFTITCLLLSVAYARPLWSDSDNDSDHEAVSPNRYGSPTNGFLNGENTDEYNWNYRNYGAPDSPPAYVSGDYGSSVSGDRLFGSESAVDQYVYTYNRHRKGKYPSGSTSTTPASSESDSD